MYYMCYICIRLPVPSSFSVSNVSGEYTDESTM